jgi:hypothetical protein
MRWNIIVECVGEDGQRSTTTLGTIERVAGSTTAENLSNSVWLPASGQRGLEHWRGEESQHRKRRE